MTYLSVVLPVYRNAEMLDELCRRLLDVLNTLTPHFEILFVDDGSPDRSWEHLERWTSADPRVRAIQLTRNFGQHPAIGAALRHARGGRIVLMDADLQDRPEDIPQLLRELDKGVDVVYTVKESEPLDWLTRLTSRLFHASYGRMIGVAIPRGIGAMRAFTRRVLEAIRAYPERHVLFGPLMFYVGFPYTVVTVKRDERPAGKSSYTFRKRLRLAANLLISYTDIPYRIAAFVGGLSLAASLVYGVLLVAQYLVLGRQLPPGLTLVLLLNTAFFGLLMVTLGILGLYLFRIYQEVLRRPRYHILQTRNLAPPIDANDTGSAAEDAAANT